MLIGTVGNVRTMSWTRSPVRTAISPPFQTGMFGFWLNYWALGTNVHSMVTRCGMVLSRNKRAFRFLGKLGKHQRVNDIEKTSRWKNTRHTYPPTYLPTYICWNRYIWTAVRPAWMQTFKELYLTSRILKSFVTRCFCVGLSQSWRL